MQDKKQIDLNRVIAVTLLSPGQKDGAADFIPRVRVAHPGKRRSAALEDP